MFWKWLSQYWIVPLQIILALISLVVMPTIANVNNDAENIALLFKASVWVIILVAPISFQLAQINKGVGKLGEQKEQKERFIDKLVECDRDLMGIQGFHKDIQGFERGGLIRAALLRQLREVKDVADKYARTGKLEEIVPNQYTTQPLLASLDSNDELRFVHYADNNDFLLSAHSLDFMKELVRKIDSNETGKARRLIVISSDDELLDPRLWLFLTFHEDHPRYSYKLILRSDYEEKQKECVMKHGRLDIGLYGNKYAYQSQQTPTAPEDSYSKKPIGAFLAKPDTFENLGTIFNRCWDSYLTWTLPEKFFLTIREGISLPVSGRFGRRPSRINLIDSVDDLMSAVKSIESIRTAFEKSGLTINDLKNPNR